MALRIVNNIAALNTQRWLGVSDTGMKKSLERLSSGYRINRAADDAAGLAISQSFRADIASFGVASRNASEASSLLQVAEGAMDQIGNMLTRLKELATQAASANAGANLDKIDAEKTQLLAEINRIANSTEYAGTKLIDGTFGTLSSEWGSTAASTTYDIDTTNGLNYMYTDTGGTGPNVSLTFNDTPAIGAETYSLATTGASTVSMTGGTTSEVFYGSFSGATMQFDTIGLTVVGDADFTTTAGNVHGDTIIVSDAGYSSTSLTSSVATGTWTVSSATADTMTLTNSRTSDAQTVTTVDAVAQTLDFDQLGIKLTLDSAYADDEFNLWAFDVASSGSSKFQIGSANTANDQIAIEIGNATTAETTGLGVVNLDLSSAAGAQAALTTIDSAIDSLSTLRGSIGGYMNRLGYAAANLSSTIENLQAAESVIRDVDMAAEMTDFTKNQILLQAGTAMLAQANMAPQQVLALFG